MLNFDIDNDSPPSPYTRPGSEITTLPFLIPFDIPSNLVIGPPSPFNFSPNLDDKRPLTAPTVPPVNEVCADHMMDSVEKLRNFANRLGSYLIHYPSPSAKL